MATEQQKEELIEILKFTPRTYTINVSGYGGEIVIGEISQEAYDYWSEKNEEDDGETLWDYDSDWDDELEVPEEFRIFEPGSWYECDDIAHESGAEMSNLNIIEVFDENGDSVWTSSMDPSDLDEHGVENEELSEVYLSELPNNTCVFVGQSTEKGTQFGGEIHLKAPFDPKNLSITYNDIDGWVLLSGIEYLGEEIENTDYSTDGKGMEMDLYKIVKEEQ